MERSELYKLSPKDIAHSVNSLIGFNYNAVEMAWHCVFDSITDSDTVEDLERLLGIAKCYYFKYITAYLDAMIENLKFSEQIEKEDADFSGVTDENYPLGI